jgi:hypothetical protein
MGYIGGTIEPDENDDFARRAVGLHNPLVVLSGPGGNAAAGIKIGRFVRLHGWDTLVPEGQSCMSACALAWLGGTRRYMGQPQWSDFMQAASTNVDLWKLSGVQVRPRQGGAAGYDHQSGPSPDLGGPFTGVNASATVLDIKKGRPDQNDR